MKATHHFLSPSSVQEFTVAQMALDTVVGGFAERVSDPYPLAAVFVGSTAFRVVRGLGFSVLGNSMGQSRIAALLINGGIHGAALTAEAGSYVSSERLLRIIFEVGERSLLRWEGPEGLKNAWVSSLLNFGAMRGMGMATVGGSQMFQHAGNVTAMLAANHASAALGFTEIDSRNWMDKIVEASVLDIQMKASMSLMHFMPGVIQWERNVDLAHEARRTIRENTREFAGFRELSPQMLGMRTDLRGEVSSSSPETGNPNPVDPTLQRTNEMLNRRIQIHLRICKDARFERLATVEGCEHVREDLLRLSHALEVQLNKTEISSETIRQKREILASSREAFENFLSNPKLQHLPFLNLKHLVPNGMTTSAFFMSVVGFGIFLDTVQPTRIHFILAGAVQIAAMFLDKGDGIVARKLKATHVVGASLDSFADFANYGLFCAAFAFVALKTSGSDLAAYSSASVIALNCFLRFGTYEFLGSHTGAHRDALPPRDILNNPLLGNDQDLLGRPSTVMPLILFSTYLAFGRSHPEAFGVVATLAGANMYSPLRYSKLTDEVLDGILRNKILLSGAAGIMTTMSICDYYSRQFHYTLFPILAGITLYEMSPFIQWGHRQLKKRKNRNRLDEV